MIWKLNNVFNSGINQQALAEELFKANKFPGMKVSSLAKKLNQLRSEKAFFRSRDPLDWYFLLRSWTLATPFELTGATTDEEAAAWIVSRKLKNKKIKFISVELEEGVIETIPDEIKERYIDAKWRQDVGVVE